jgi:hypothetical protein
MTAGSGPESSLPDSWGQVPDDASSLEADRLSWLAEQRTRHPRARLHGLGGPLLALAAALVLAITGLVLLLMPGHAPAPVAGVPLADVPVVGAPTTGPPTVTLSGGASGTSSAADAPAGATATVEVEGRRLPAVPLAGRTGPLTAADLRPAVITLVPDGCGCATVLHEIYLQAREFRLTLWVIGSPATTPESLDRLVQDVGAGHPSWAIDPTSALRGVLGPGGLTLLAVRADGVISSIGRDLPLDPARLPALEPLLARMAASTG